MTKYDKAGEGYAAFGTVIIDAVLNRIFPYLVEWALTKDYTIRLDREEKLTDDLTPVVVYTLDGHPSTDEEKEKAEAGESLIDGNPYPKPPEIDPTEKPVDPSIPNGGDWPEWPGIPYDPYNPLNREPSPYPPRQDQPDIPYIPSTPTNPDSPIQPGGRDEYQQARESLPRVEDSGRRMEIPITPSGSESPEPGEEEKPEPGEQEKPEPGEEEKPEATDDIKALLLKILQEIIKQGEANRDALRDSTLQLTAAIAGNATRAEQAIQEATELIQGVMDDQQDAATGILDVIKGIIKDALDAAKQTAEQPEGLLSEILGTISDTLSEWYNWGKSVVGGILDGIGKALDGLLNFALTAGLAVLEEIAESIKTFYGMYFDAQKALLDFMTGSLDFSLDDWTKYICEFLSQLEKIKSNCAWVAGKAG